MKLAVFFVALVALSLALPWARADLTLVQSVEGSSGSNEMTMKLKGDKMRIDVSPQITTIIDAKTGEMINLMNDQKKVMRISGEKVRATMEMAQQFKANNGKKEIKEKPKFVATGKKETINGYETEQYTWETPDFKATYWSLSNIRMAPPFSNSCRPSIPMFGKHPIRRCRIIVIFPACPSRLSS